MARLLMVTSRLLIVVLVVRLLEIVVVIARLLIIRSVVAILLILRRERLKVLKAKVIEWILLRVETKLVWLSLPLIIEVLLLIEKRKRILRICCLETDY